MKLEEAADKIEIQELLAKYADAVVRRDAEAWADTWATDGEWQVLGQSAVGPEALVTLWKGLMSQLPFVIQLPHNGWTELEGDTGRGRWYVNEHGQDKNGNAILSMGVYHDQYVKVDGAWRFRFRRFEPLYMGSPDGKSNPSQPSFGRELGSEKA